MRYLNDKFSEFCEGKTKPAFSTPFPVTYFDFSEPGYSNARIEKALSLMDKEKLSPYLAWAMTLGYTCEDLPRLLKADHIMADRLVADPYDSPSVEHIEHFCHKLGIHPAYLQPRPSEKDLPCHPNIMQAIVKVATNEKTQERDLRQARDAMEWEVAKFEHLETTSKVASAYLLTAYQLTEKTDIDEIIPASLRHKFANSSAAHRPRLETGLDLFERSLEETIEKVEKLIAPTLLKYQIKENQALELAEIIFGDDRAEKGLQALLYEMREADVSLDEDIWWGYCENNTRLEIAHSSRTKDWKFKTPLLDINFKSRAQEILNCEAAEVIENLIDLIPFCIERQRDCDLAKQKIKPQIEQAERPLEKFLNWRKSDICVNQIALFTNCKLAESVLGKKEFIKNVPAIIDHSWDYVFPALLK